LAEVPANENACFLTVRNMVIGLAVSEVFLEGTRRESSVRSETFAANKLKMIPRPVRGNGAHIKHETWMNKQDTRKPIEAPSGATSL